MSYDNLAHDNVDQPRPRVIRGAPGHTTSAVLQIANPTDRPVEWSARAVGLIPTGRHSTDDFASLRLEPHTTASLTVPIDVPTWMGVGEHAGAIEVESDAPGDTSRLLRFTLVITSAAALTLTPRPALVTGRRRARLSIGITNHESLPMDVVVHGDPPAPGTPRAEHVRVKVRSPRFRLQPDESVRRRVSLRAPRRWRGESVQHNVAVRASGAASSTSVIVPYVQKPLIGLQTRTAFALATVMALLIGGVWAYTTLQNDDDSIIMAIDADGDGFTEAALDADGQVIPGSSGRIADAGSGVDANGDGFFDPATDDKGKPIAGSGGAQVALLGTGLDLDGDGRFDPLLDAAGDPIKNADGSPTGGGLALFEPPPDLVNEYAQSDDGFGQPARDVVADVGTRLADEIKEQSTLTQVSFRGLVTAGDELAGIGVRLQPLSLSQMADQPVQANPIRGLRSAAPSAGLVGKVWSARFSQSAAAVSPVRQSESLAQQNAGASDATVGDGVWRIDGLLRRQSYEAAFFKPGYNTVSFVVTAPEVGDPESLDVDLSPAVGVLRGTAIARSTGRSLGNVEIVVTDGTNTFSTISASESGEDPDDLDVGEWEITGLSTPATYTITGSRAGFGNAVVVESLAPGGQELDVDVPMISGVGSITGLTRSGSVGLPGVNVTASNGDTTRTSTSSTVGPVGRFDIGALPVPGTYTVTARAGGFTTATRRVELTVANPNRSIDLPMTTTTQTLSGRVTRAVVGQPPGSGPGIDGVGITIERGDLTFRTQTGDPGGRTIRTQTAPDPLAGNYDIGNLQAGDYTVTFRHYQHVSQTRSITIAPGVDFTLDVDLDSMDPPEQIRDSALILRVFDPLGSKEISPFDVFLDYGEQRLTPPERTEEELKNCIDTTDSSDNNASVCGAKFGAKIDNVGGEKLAAGTYTVVVKAVGYDLSAPQRVSIGQGRTATLVVNLKASGEAKGTVVDATTGDPIPGDDYTLELVPVNEDGGKVEAGRVRTTITSGRLDPTDAGGAVSIWETPDNTLAVGVWEVEIPLLNGYKLLDDNALLVDGEAQDGLLANRFRIVSGSGTDAVIVGGIRVVPYPNIGGRVYRPQFDGQNTTYTLLDTPGLEVTLRCLGRDNALTVNAGASSTLTDNSWSVSRTLIEDWAGDGRLPLPCPLVVTASVPGLEPAISTLDNFGVDDNGSDGYARTDRSVDTAIRGQIDTFTGTAFWRDYGVTNDPLVDLDERDVFTPRREPKVLATAIVDFEPTVDTLGPSGGEPPLTSFDDDDITPTTKGLISEINSGTWAFRKDANDDILNGDRNSTSQQVFGSALYEFDDPAFDSSVTIVVDENGRRSIAASNNVVLGGAPNPDNLAVELLPLSNGTINGKVTIDTIDDTVQGGVSHKQRSLAQVLIAQQRPVLTAPNPRAGLQPNEFISEISDHTITGDFTISKAYPGTWSLGFTEPANHEFRPRTDPRPTPDPCDSLSRCTARLQPDGRLDKFDVHLVENGQLTVELVNRAGGAAPAAFGDVEVTVIDSISRLPLELTASTVVGNSYTFIDVPVSREDPLEIPLTYDVQIKVPRFDTRLATIVDTTDTTKACENTTPPVTGFGADYASIANRPFCAGTKRTLRVTLDPFGFRTGTVRGRIGPNQTTPLTDGYTVNATREYFIAQPGANPVEVTQDIPKADAEIQADGSFKIFGPPGWYTIDVTHPDFGGPGATVPQGEDLVDSNGASLASNVFRIDSSTSGSLGVPYILDATRSRLQLTVVDSIDNTGVLGGPVANATYLLTSNRLPAGTTGGIVPTNGLIPELLYPGLYELTVSGFGPDGTARFPTTIKMLEIGPDGTVDGLTTRVTVSLPSRNGTITGPITALNDRNVAVDFVTLNDVVVDRPGGGIVNVVGDYTVQPFIRNDGTPQPQDEVYAATSPITRATDGTYSYTFRDVPTGSHAVTPPDITGFVAPASPGREGVVGNSTTSFPTMEYTVKNTTVQFRLTAAPSGLVTSPPGQPLDFRGIDVTLTSPISDFEYEGVVAGDVVTIANVAPENGDFDLVITFDERIPTGLFDKSSTKHQIPIDNDGVAGTDLGVIPLTGSVAVLRIAATQRALGMSRDLQPPGTVTLRDSLGTILQTLRAPVGLVAGRYEFRPVPAGTYNVEVANENGDALRFTPASIDVTVAGGTRVEPPVVEIKQLARVTVAFANDDNLINGRPRLVEPIDPNDPATPRVVRAPITDSPPGGVYTFDVPGGSYELRYVADNYPLPFSSTGIEPSVVIKEIPGVARPGDDAPTFITVGLGEARALSSITLPRVVRVTLTGERNARARVRNFGGSVISFRQLSLDGNDPGPLFYEFRSDDRSDGRIEPLPLTGDLEVDAVQGGKPLVLFPEPPKIPSDRLGVAQTFAAEFRPELTLTGTITVDGTNVPPGTTDSPTRVTAFAPATADDPEVTLPGSVDPAVNGAGVSTYSIPGLTTTLRNGRRDWQIIFDVPGIGRLPAGATAPTVFVNKGKTAVNLDLQVIPDPIPVGFTITAVQGATIVGAKVVVTRPGSAGETRESALLNATDAPSVVVPEHWFREGLTWTVTGAVDQVLAGTQTLPTTAVRGGMTVDAVTLTSTKIVVKVLPVDAAITDPGVPGAIVTICDIGALDPADGTCTTVAATPTSSSGGNYTFSQLEPGVYPISVTYTDSTTDPVESFVGTGEVTVGLQRIPTVTPVTIRLRVRTTP